MQSAYRSRIRLRDSLISHLEDLAISRRCQNLNLPNQAVFWLGYSGMVWKELAPRFQLSLLSNPPPVTIVIHLGGNDIVTVTQGKLIRSIKKDINYIASVFPSAAIVWSDILPRLKWRGAPNDPQTLYQLDQKRKRINRAGRQVIRQLANGKYIVHEIDTVTPGLFRPDGVHLTLIGNSIFLNTMQEALLSFIKDPKRKFYDAN